MSKFEEIGVLVSNMMDVLTVEQLGILTYAIFFGNDLGDGYSLDLEIKEKMNKSTYSLFVMLCVMLGNSKDEDEEK